MSNDVNTIDAKFYELNTAVKQMGIRRGMPMDEISSRLKEADLQEKTQKLFGKGTVMELNYDHDLIIRNVSADIKNGLRIPNSAFNVVNDFANGKGTVHLEKDHLGDVEDLRLAMLDAEEIAIHRQLEDAAVFISSMNDIKHVDKYMIHDGTDRYSDEKNETLYVIHRNNASDIYMSSGRRDVYDLGDANKGMIEPWSKCFNPDLSGNLIPAVRNGLVDHVDVSAEKYSEFENILANDSSLVTEHDVLVCDGVVPGHLCEDVFLLVDGKNVAGCIGLYEYEDDEDSPSCELQEFLNVSTDFGSDYFDYLKKYVPEIEKGSGNLIVVEQSGRNPIPSEWKDMAAGNGMQDTNDKDYGD